MLKTVKPSRRIYETGKNIGSPAVSLMSDADITFPVCEFPSVLRDYISKAADATLNRMGRFC